MSSTNKTPHYSLPQYIGTDKPTYLGDANDAYQIIDTNMYTANTNATNAVNIANQAGTAVAGLTPRVAEIETDVTSIQTQLTATTNLANSNKQSLDNLVNHTAGKTFISLGTYLSGYSPSIILNTANYSVVTIGTQKFLSIFGSFNISFTGTLPVGNIVNIGQLDISKDFQDLITPYNKRDIFNIGFMNYSADGIAYETGFFYRVPDNKFYRNSSPNGTTVTGNELNFSFQSFITLN